MRRALAWAPCAATPTSNGGKICRSKRKLDVQEGKPVLAEPPPLAVQTPLPPSSPADGRGGKLAGHESGRAAAPVAASLQATATESESGNRSGGEGAPEVPLPTLADAQALTPESDFKPFMARGVAADVKNAAMKKLFTDPHYNVMDRLDTYIDDYSLPRPDTRGHAAPDGQRQISQAV